MIFVETVAFESPAAVSDEYGRTESGWTAEFTCRAHFLYLRGGETVQAARLEGRQPIVATIRSHDLARQVTPGWRMIDTQRSVTYNVRSVVPTDDRRHVEVTAESGVAV